MIREYNVRSYNFHDISSPRHLCLSLINLMEKMLLLVEEPRKIKQVGGRKWKAHAVHTYEDRKKNW